MLLTIADELEHVVMKIANKINMTGLFTAKLLLKESVKIRLTGIEQGLLDVKNDMVTQAGNVIKSRHYTHHLSNHQNNTNAINELNAVIDLLKSQQPIPEKYCDQELNGGLGVLRELQLKDHNLFLFYTISEENHLTLIDFGEFSEIFTG